MDTTYLYLKTTRFSETYLSIDLGINNNFTCYDSVGSGFIINGFLPVDHYFNKKIAYYQSISDTQQVAAGIQYPKLSKRVSSLYRKKKNSIADFLHKATRSITNYCLEHDIHTVVIGDITGIRKDKNLGRLNQQLHSLPYKRVYVLLSYKLALNGIALIKQKECFSNQCSPISPNVSKTFANKSNRKNRGLYVDGCFIYNADMVGAYNILRLYLQSIKSERNIPIIGLSSPYKVAV